jgi:hypothetical protein
LRGPTSKGEQGERAQRGQRIWHSAQRALREPQLPQAGSSAQRRKRAVLLCGVVARTKASQSASCKQAMLRRNPGVRSSATRREGPPCRMLAPSPLPSR